MKEALAHLTRREDVQSSTEPIAFIFGEYRDSAIFRRRHASYAGDRPCHFHRYIGRFCVFRRTVTRMWGHDTELLFTWKPKTRSSSY
jgi:hypothetical protein